MNKGDGISAKVFSVFMDWCAPHATCESVSQFLMKISYQ